MQYYNKKVFKENKDTIFMKRQGLKLVVILLMFSFFISSVSAGNVIFRDGKIISSGNVSTDEKFVGDGSGITNITVTTNLFNQVLNTTSNVTFDTVNVSDLNLKFLGDNTFNFAKLQFNSLNNKIWQFAHRNETSLNLTNNFLLWFYNGTTWNYGLRITPELNFGFGNKTSLDNVTLNQRLNVFGNANITGEITGNYFIGDGSKLTNISSSTTNPFNQNLNTTSNATFNYLNISNNLRWNQQYYPAITQEVFGQLLDFGINYNQSGYRNYSALGGFLRLDSRGSIFNPVFSVISNKIGQAGGGGNETFLLSLYENGNLNVSGEIYLKNATPISKWLYNQTIAVNPFNQVLNKSSNVTFNQVNFSDDFAVHNGIPNKIALWVKNYGFGISTGSLDYTTDNGASHTFYANQTKLATLKEEGLNVTGNVTSNHYTGTLTKYHSSGNTSIMGYSTTGKETGFTFNWQNSSSTNVWADVIGLNSLNLLAWAIDFKLSNDNKFRFGNNNDFQMGFDSTVRRFHLVSNLNNTNLLRNNPGLGINHQGWVAISETQNAPIHNATAPLDVNGSSTFRKSINVTGYVNATVDLCISGSGKCLNDTVSFSTDPSVNNTIIYWNNNTRAWSTLTPNATSVYLTICNDGKMQWISIGSVCPL